MIKQLLQSYWNICLFRNSPEKTPYSHSLMIISGLLYGFLIISQWQLTDIQDKLDFDLSVYRAIGLILSYAVYTAILVHIFKFGQRLVQTLTSLYCCHFIVHIIAMPVLTLIPFMADANMKNPFVLGLGIAYLVLTLALSIWQILISAEIYRFSLEVSSIKSILASVGLIATNLLTISFWQ